MTLNYKIYQIDMERPGAEQLAFRPYAPCAGRADTVCSDAYILAYRGTLACESGWDSVNILEHLFQMLNTEHPADYKARSLSVSDVVSLLDDDGERFYYCDVFGFQPITFLPRSEV